MIKFYQPLGGNCTKTYQQPDDKKQNNLGAKYDNQENNR